MPDSFSNHWITSSNAHLLAEIAPGVFDEPIEPDRLERYLSGSHNWMCVTMRDDLVVGMCMAVIHHHPDKPTELYLDEIGTGDDWRRQGIAEGLMKALCERADEADIDEIWVATEIDNEPAKALYEKTGAKGEEAIYYYLEW